jgi:hypothetical protein
VKTVKDKLGQDITTGRTVCVDSPRGDIRGTVIAISEDEDDGTELMVATTKGATLFILPESVVVESVRPRIRK